MLNRVTKYVGSRAKLPGFQALDLPLCDSPYLNSISLNIDKKLLFRLLHYLVSLYIKSTWNTTWHVVSASVCLLLLRSFCRRWKRPKQKMAKRKSNFVYLSYESEQWNLSKLALLYRICRILSFSPSKRKGLPSSAWSKVGSLIGREGG